MIRHGWTKSPLKRKVYSCWVDIKRRCYEESHKEFVNYGGRGIKLQPSWEDSPVAFCEYISNLEDFSKGRSLDRIDNNRGYVEGNLRWATAALQTRNQRKQVNNTSGICGVTWYENDTGGTRAIAWWYDENKPRSKSFPVKRLGLLPAFKMACDHREKMINQLNDRGAGYAEQHGK